MMRILEGLYIGLYSIKLFELFHQIPIAQQMVDRYFTATEIDGLTYNSIS
jgi:hypothetical protein